eukprot:2858672-Amphidinium_carterae.1
METEMSSGYGGNEPADCGAAAPAAAMAEGATEMDADGRGEKRARNQAADDMLEHIQAEAQDLGAEATQAGRAHLTSTLEWPLICVRDGT